jgi:hypothetical protein
MFILPSADGFSAVAQVLVIVGALLGPGQNPKEMVSVKQKVEALSQLAQTGDLRWCEDVINAILEKKGEAVKELKVYQESRDQLHEGIARDLKWLQNNTTADANSKTLKQKDIDSKARGLEVIRFHEERLDKLIAGREREEQTFTLLCEVIKSNRRASKAP